MVEAPTPYEALMRTIDVLGSQSELARVCGVSPTAVWKWVQSSKRLPEPYVLAVEAATGVPRHLLRPDIYPADLGPGPRWHGVDQRVDRFQAAVMARGGAVSKRGGSRWTAA